jgi:hypothetical protein
MLIELEQDGSPLDFCLVSAFADAVMNLFPSPFQQAMYSNSLAK